MSIVQFLETLGASPNGMSATNYASAVDALDADDAVRNALLARDQDGLNRLLTGRAAMRCFILVPD